MLSCLAPLMPSSWLKLEPSVAGAFSGALAFAFAAQPINHALKELESNGKRQNSTRRGREKHAPSLASVSAARTTGNGRFPVNGTDMH